MFHFMTLSLPVKSELLTTTGSKGVGQRGMGKASKGCEMTVCRLRDNQCFAKTQAK